ncbi:MAG: iron-sulfur cluster assembly scaffold protein [Acidimicrobiales bacterium]
MAGLEDLYREIILDHYRSPRNQGELPCPPARRVEGFNPLCGDEIVVFLEVGSSGCIDAIRISGQGCSISQASASMMTDAVKGLDPAGARQLCASFEAMLGIEPRTPAAVSAAPPVTDPFPPPRSLPGDLPALSGVARFPVRIKCALLPWYTLLEALDANPESPAEQTEQPSPGGQAE